MKRYLFILICSLVASSVLFAQFDNAGTSAATFLKIAVGARAVALGGSVVSSVNDASALFWNPSGMAHVESNEILFSNNKWIADLQHNCLAGVVPVGNFGVLGLSISYLSMGDMKVTTWEKTAGTGETFSAYSAAIGLGWARKMSDRFYVGLHVKYINETISNSSASSVAVDVGSQYDIGWLRIGMSVMNFGPQIRMEGRDLRTRVDPFQAGSNPSDVVANLETQPWSLPMLFQLGVSAVPIHTEMLKVTAMVGFRDDRDYKPQMSAGLEIGLFDLFFVRGGMKTWVGSNVVDGLSNNEDRSLLSAGAGVSYRIPGTVYRVRFDYAYQELPYFGNAQLITFAFNY